MPEGAADGGNALSESPFGAGVSSQVPPPPPPDSAPPEGTVLPCGKCEDDQEKVRIRVSLFFDGTLNNRENVAEGPASAAKGDSYTAGLSNVARLSKVSMSKLPPDCDHHLTLYTEGIGTVSHGEDQASGFAFGMGDTGVKQKVEAGIRNAVDEIAATAGRRTLLHVHVDTFGFSRGAAAARYCIWKCLNEPGKTLAERLAQAGHPPGTVVVKFAGLFDTVASFGLVHRNDTSDLCLTAVASAVNVLHLAAADEHRENFRLTNINSKGGAEFFLPGAHSDIGGGYADTESEADWPLLDLVVAPETLDHARKAAERDRDWLVSSGWYAREELKVTYAGIRGTRKPIPCTYSWIPLRLMAEYARLNGIEFEAAMDLQYASPPGVLKEAEGQIRAAIGDGSAKKASRWLAPDPAGDPGWLKTLRHEYLHFSARYGTTMGAHSPQWTSGGPWSGRRLRKEQDG